MGTVAKQPDPFQLLPDELLLQVFGHLAELPAEVLEDLEPWYTVQPPFRTLETDYDPHPGLRSYPFLAQVCSKWREVLSTDAALALWESIVVDFGHELITSIHTPLRWSSQRPSDEEFQAGFDACRISAAKVLEFVKARKHAVRALTLMNSEGYFSSDEQSEYISMAGKHDFGAMHFGMLLGVLGDRLHSLTISRCNDVIGCDAHMWSAVACLAGLTRLAIEDVRASLSSADVAPLAQLKDLRELALNADMAQDSWQAGLAEVPEQWSSLTTLRNLELRHHNLLQQLPHWLSSLKQLTRLDVSYCGAGCVAGLTHLTQLHSLGLRGLGLADPLPPQLKARSSAPQQGQQGPDAQGQQQEQQQEEQQQGHHQQEQHQQQEGDLAAAAAAAAVAVALGMPLLHPPVPHLHGHAQPQVQAQQQQQQQQQQQHMLLHIPPEIAAFVNAAGAAADAAANAAAAAAAAAAALIENPQLAHMEAQIANILQEAQIANAALAPAPGMPLPLPAPAPLLGLPPAAHAAAPAAQPLGAHPQAAAALAAPEAAPAAALAAAAGGGAVMQVAQAPVVYRLPDLSTLTRLTALQISTNGLTRVPAFLGNMPQLEWLDLSDNIFLEAPERLRMLLRLKQLRYVDVRGVHSHELSMLVKGSSVWAPAKCTSMEHINELVRALGSRRRSAKVWLDLPTMPTGM